MSTSCSVMPMAALETSSRSIGVWGISHHNSPVAIRERFAISPERRAELLKQAFESEGVEEVVLLSTCNRVEFIASFELTRKPLVQAAASRLFQSLSNESQRTIESIWYDFSAENAVSHLFKVASGLDSMVLGEPQILGQLKAAYEAARMLGTTDILLNQLFHRAFAAAKRVRSMTRVGHLAVSLCYASRTLAQQIFGELDDASVLVLGAGEMATLSLKHFRTAGVTRFFIGNRSQANAETLARTVQGTPFPLSHCGKFIPSAEVVINTVSRSEGGDYLLSAGMAELSLKKRSGQPQLFIDLAVPRNIAPEIGEFNDAFLYDIDHLKNIVQQNMDRRQIESERALAIVAERVDTFCRWLGSRVYEPSIKVLRAQGENIAEAELERTIRGLRRAGWSDAQLLQAEPALRAMAQAIVKKLLHRPTTRLRGSATEEPQLHEYFVDLLINGNLEEPDDS